MVNVRPPPLPPGQPLPSLKAAVRATVVAVALRDDVASHDSIATNKGTAEAPLISLITSTGTLGHLLLFFGGMYDFPEDIHDRIYATIWSVCFFACAAACCANLTYKSEPYHNLPSDLMTAYIHVPVFLAWRFWRRMLADSHFIRVVDPVRSLREEQQATLRSVLRIFVLVVFLLMITVSLLVLSAYAVPATLQCHAQGNGTAAAATSAATGHGFSCFHA